MSDFMIIGALAISPANKAITRVDEHQWLVVDWHWTDTEVWYSAYLIDIREGDVTHCRAKIGGPDALQEWVDACVFGASIDVDERRWNPIENITAEKIMRGVENDRN